MKKLLFILILISVFSCRSVKKDTHEKEETINSDFVGIQRNSGNSEKILETTINIKKTLASKNDNETENENYETTVEPIDSSKPASYIEPNGKKHFLDNAKMTYKKSKQKTKTKSQNSDNSQEVLRSKLIKKAKQKTELAAKIKSAANGKELTSLIDRKAGSFWNLLWILIPILLILIFKWLWKKYKNNNSIL